MDIGVYDRVSLHAIHLLCTLTMKGRLVSRPWCSFIVHYVLADKNVVMEKKKFNSN